MSNARVSRRERGSNDHGTEVPDPVQLQACGTRYSLCGVTPDKQHVRRDLLGDIGRNCERGPLRCFAQSSRADCDTMYTAIDGRIPNNKDCAAFQSVEIESICQNIPAVLCLSCLVASDDSPHTIEFPTRHPSLDDQPKREAVSCCFWPVEHVRFQARGIFRSSHWQPTV